MAAYAREPRAYELMAILLPELADEDLTGQLERVSKYITDVNGSIKEILNDSPWGRRRLAYTIRHNSVDYRDGIYVIWHFDLEPSRMGEIERELKLDVRVIRYLLVHDDPKWGPKNGGNQPQGEDAEGGPTRERPASERPAAERPAAVQAPAAAETSEPTTETPAATDAPAADEAAEAPAADASTETPVTEEPAAEAPAVEETSDAAPAETAADETAAVEETSEAPAGDETADVPAAEDATETDAEKTEE